MYFLSHGNASLTVSIDFTCETYVPSQEITVGCILMLVFASFTAVNVGNIFKYHRVSQSFVRATMQVNGEAKNFTPHHAETPYAGDIKIGRGD